MVLLVTIGLVIVSALTLALGFIQDNVTLIYGSILCSVAAAVILIIAGRSSGAQRVATAGGPAPLDLPPSLDDNFPIPDYDELLVTEVVPMLSNLSLIELHVVRAREESGKARASVLRRIDTEIEARQAPSMPAPSSLVDDDEPTIAVPAFRAPEPEDEDDGEEPFPIEDYDDLRASEIMPLLPQLYSDELERVAARERSGANRGAIIETIESLLSPEPAPVKKAAPAKKKAPAKQAPTAVAKKAAAPASAKKAAPAKKAPAAKKAAPAKKAAAPAKKAAAPAKKAAAPAKNAAPAVKKAAPVKKAAAPAKKAVAKKAPAKKAAR